MSTTTINTGRLIAGLALIVVGALFLLDQAGAINAGSVLSRWWPLVIVAIGFVQLMVSPRAFLGPTIIMLIGLLLLGSTLDLYSVDVWAVIWPAIIIVIGLSVLFGRGSRLGVVERADTGERAHAFAAFSGTDVLSQSNRFEGADVTALFGGATLDLRRANLAPEGAVVDVTVAFGGATILVPHGWEVITNGLPIFAGFENKTTGDEIPEGAPRLLVRGTALFGGVEIKHEK